MKQRYFSPDVPPSAFYRQKNNPKLRWIGSTAKLNSFNSMNKLDDDQQIKIGDYIYFKNKQIGSGYSSKVYKAKKVNKEQQYAIKVIDLRNFSNSNLQMLENQIQILKIVDHPNILKCYDIIKTKSKCYIITQYCPHGDLLAYISKKGTLPEKQTLQIVEQIITGYKYLISQNIIHRDLKPANILKSGSMWKIADFGFAIKSCKEIKTKYNVGTPLYMPPQSLIDNVYSSRSDIFSIGIIMYELIVGCTPWQSKTQKDLIKKMTLRSFRIPQKAKISPKIQTLLKKMCQTKDKNRMSRQQFLVLDFNEGSNQNPQQPTAFKQQKSPKSGYIKRINHRSLETILYKTNHPLPHPNLKSQASIIYNNMHPVSSINSLSKRNSAQDPQINNKNYSKQNINLSIQNQYRNNLSSDAYNVLSSLAVNRSNNNANLNVSKSDECHRRTLINSNYIVINQLHYCRFQYYIIKNQQYLLIEPKNAQKLSLIIFKHVLKLIKQLSDTDKNWLKIPLWQQLIVSKMFANTLATIKDYALRYERQYLVFIKNIDISVIRQVNRQFPEFATLASFSLQSYNKIIQYISPIIRINNHKLGLYLIRDENKSETLDNSQICNIQALKSLLKYYNLLKMSLNNYQDYQYFEANSSIKVQVDYRKSVCNAESYIELRKQIKNL